MTLLVFFAALIYLVHTIGLISEPVKKKTTVVTIGLAIVGLGLWLLVACGVALPRWFHV